MAVETKQKFNGFGRYFKSTNNAEKLLTRVIVIAVTALAFVVAFHVFQMQIFPTWQVAITIFILVLPVCLFLQAYLNVQAVKDERYSKLQEGFRKAYARYIKQYAPKIIKDEDIANEDDFRNLIRERSTLLMNDGQLYSIFRQAYQLYLSYKHNRIRIKGNPDINEIKYWLLRFELDELLKMIVSRQMKEDGTDFPSYLLPLSFFLFMYFSGFLVVTSFIDAIFNPGTDVNNAAIPLFPGQEIPIIVVQWGFMGGLVYTSISLLNRFLRNDLVPRVYFNAAFRLILSAVVAIIIYFFYMFANPDGKPDNTTPPQILLLCFLAGVAPIQFLIHFADTQLSKLNQGWKRRATPGNRPITQLEGIDSVTSQRLSEEGINYIQEMALCNYIELSSKTNYPIELVHNWKDQAIFNTLAGGIVVYKSENNPTDKKPISDNKEFLSDTLEDKLGIRTISSFIDLWNNITSRKENGINEQKVFLSYVFNFADTDEKKFVQSKYIFDNISKQGKAMFNNSIRIYPIDEIPSQDNGQITNLLTSNTDPKQQTSNTDPKQQTSNTDPKQQTSNTDPKQQTSNTDPKQQTSNTDPKQQTSNTDPKQQTSNTDPKQQTSNTDPKQQTSNTDPKQQTSNTDPKQQTSNTDPKQQTSNTDPKQQTSNTDPKQQTSNTDPKQQTSVPSKQ